MAYTLNDLMTEIALDFDYTTDLPPTTSQEYMRRVKLINRYEREWARLRDYKWRVLYKTTTLTTTANVATVSLPSDIANNGLQAVEDGYIRFSDGNNTYYYRLVSSDQVANTSDKVVWITGNSVSGYTLNISPTPTEAYTITIDYFSSNLAYDVSNNEQPLLVTSTDTTKCTNPMWIVYKVLATLNRTDDNSPLGNDYLVMAGDAYREMMGDENILNFNQSQTIPDMAEIQGYPNIGE